MILKLLSIKQIYLVFTTLFFIFLFFSCNKNSNNQANVKDSIEIDDKIFLKDYNTDRKIVDKNNNENFYTYNLSISHTVPGSLGSLNVLMQKLEDIKNNQSHHDYINY